LKTIGQFENALIGDLYLKVRHMGGIKNSTICRIGFNTSFIDSKHGFIREELDPDNIRKDNRIHSHFYV